MSVVTFLNDVSKSVMMIPAEVCAARQAIAEWSGVYGTADNFVTADGCRPCRAAVMEHSHRLSARGRIMSSLF